MKTQFIIIVALILLSSLGVAQVPNPSFESWAGGKPTGWSYTNLGNLTNVTQTNSAHTGSSAVKLDGFGGIQCPGAPNANFPITQVPFALTGWFKSNFTGADYLGVFTSLSKNGAIIGSASLDIYTVTSVYQKFGMIISYSVPGDPDSAYVSFAISGANSSAIVDDVDFDYYPTGIEMLTSGKVELLKLINNPTQNELRIEYHNEKAGYVKLFLCDLNGKVIKTCLDQYQGSGQFRVDESLESIEEGIYLVRLETSSGFLTQKFCVLR